MLHHELVQGSTEWLWYRAKMKNASDVPAMLGISKYKTRTQLLDEKKTGIVPEVDSTTQRRFDDGHRFEALSRPIAEAIIGQDLYPVTGSEGEYSASFDGLTMLEDIAFEHKSLNDDIRAYRSADDIDEMYASQMEQQLMVSGAEKCLFLATKWGSNDELLEKFEFWYTSNPIMRQRIIDGWAQFDIDLENHVPTQAIETPKAEAIMALPGLAIQIKGEVTLSNLPEFQKAATAFISNISTELVTDEDFVKAEAVCKFCKDAEDNIDSTKASAIAQTQSIDELMRTLDFVKAQLRDKRLLLTNLVKSEKENRKMQIVNDARDAFTLHVQSHAPTRLQVTIPDFASATKNKKTLSSMKEAVNQVLVNSKIEIDALARDIKRKTDWFNDIAKDHIALFADLQTIIYKENSDFQLLVNSRIKDFKVEEEKKLEAIKAQAALDAHAKLAQEAAAAKPIIPEGDGITNASVSLANTGAIADAVTYGTGVMSVSVDEKSSVVAGHIETQYFFSTEPSVNEIVCAVAASFKVDEMQAHKWLISADFTKFEMKKAA